MSNSIYTNDQIQFLKKHMTEAEMFGLVNSPGSATLGSIKKATDLLAQRRMLELEEQLGILAQRVVLMFLILEDLKLMSEAKLEKKAAELRSPIKKRSKRTPK